MAERFLNFHTESTNLSKYLSKDRNLTIKAAKLSEISYLSLSYSHVNMNNFFKELVKLIRPNKGWHV